jgi:hypothetical protein
MSTEIEWQRLFAAIKKVSATIIFVNSTPRQLKDRRSSNRSGFGCYDSVDGKNFFSHKSSVVI